jgi:hypothetical protein
MKKYMKKRQDRGDMAMIDQKDKGNVKRARQPIPSK